MNIMNGIMNLLNAIAGHWAEIIICAVLIFAVYTRIRAFMEKSDDEKIALAKGQIKNVMLKLVTEAEEKYSGWRQAGAIKRSTVISQIYDKYPILSKVVDQDAIIKWLDEVIVEALKTMREIVAENTPGNQ